MENSKIKESQREFKFNNSFNLFIDRSIYKWTIKQKQKKINTTWQQLKNLKYTNS